MENKTQFPEGIIFKKPKEGAPEFVRGSLSFKVEEFTKYLKEKNNNGWVNIDILKSKSGNTYLKLNEWKKDSTLTGEEKTAIKQAKEKTQAQAQNENDYANMPF